MRIFLALWLALGLPALAQEAQPAPPPQDCSAAEHRQFDFWIGEFEVTTPDGQVAGHNTIAPALGGCLLTEHWRSANGNEGRSINFYDRADRQWHQVWVDGSGWVLRLAGGFHGESMLLAGATRGRDGRMIQHRITWTPQADGSVRQHWETSNDTGLSWATVFDGRYRRAD